MTKSTDIPETSISLVLGSGGARGLAHIGIIHWLEEHNYRIDSISGCSMGALIGGVYAAEKLDVFEQWVSSITKFEMLSLLDIAWGMSGLVKGDKIINTLISLLDDLQIEDLPIAYTAVAADIENEKEVWINSGRLFDAIRASISLPLIFTPFVIDDVALIDGGVLNPVPIAPTFGDKTDMTIAVNLGGPVEIISEPPKQPEAKPEFELPFQEEIDKFIEHFQSKKVEIIEKAPEWDVYDIANQAFDAMQSTIARHKLAAYPPDLSINIPRNACGMLEFDRAKEMIELGYQKAEEQLGHLKKAV